MKFGDASVNSKRKANKMEEIVRLAERKGEREEGKRGRSGVAQERTKLSEGWSASITENKKQHGRE